MPDEEFEEYVGETKAKGRELTSSATYKIAMRRAAQAVAEAPSKPVPDGSRIVTDLADLIAEGERFSTSYAILHGHTTTGARAPRPATATEP
jgi:hypothetical protein